MKLGAGSQSWRLIRVFQGVLLLAVAGCAQPALTSAVAVPSIPRQSVKWLRPFCRS
jgi:hypothetical protein